MVLNPQWVPEALRGYFASRKSIALAFSGGCDSAYLFYAAQACGVDVRAYYVHSSFQPEFELRDARRLARELGAQLNVLEVDVLADAGVRENSGRRCYHCKRLIFSAICAAAQAAGCTHVVDGTNASDDAGSRPGLRALEELKVESPLRLCGIRKKQVRELSRGAGLFSWNKPAYACLATRIPTDTAIDAQALRRVEAAENVLAGMGFADFRVRCTERGCRLELPDGQMARLVARRAEVLAALKGDFEEITLNLTPREEREG